MSRTYSQTLNAAQIHSITSTNTVVNGTLTFTAKYIVGFLAVSGLFSAMQGANFDSADLTVTTSTTIASFLTQMKNLVASQEALDLASGDSVTFRLP